MGERIGSDAGWWPYPHVSVMTETCRECGSRERVEESEAFGVSVTLCAACAARMRRGEFAYRMAHEEGGACGTARLERRERGGKWRKAPRQEEGGRR